MQLCVSLCNYAFHKDRLLRMKEHTLYIKLCNVRLKQSGCTFVHTVPLSRSLLSSCFSLSVSLPPISLPPSYFSPSPPLSPPSLSVCIASETSFLGCSLCILHYLSPDSDIPLLIFWFVVTTVQDDKCSRVNSERRSNEKGRPSLA